MIVGLVRTKYLPKVSVLHSRNILVKTLYGVLISLIFTRAATTFAQDPLRIVIDEPSENAQTNDAIHVAGWAVDPSAGQQNGPGVDQIRLYAGADCNGELLAQTVPNVSRSDVVQALALDSSYTNSGFAVDLVGLRLGSLTLTVCAYRADSLSMQMSRTISVVAATSESVSLANSPTSHVLITLVLLVVAFGLLFWLLERWEPRGSGVLSRRWMRVALILIGLSPLVIVLIHIQRYGVNVPYWDEWDLLVQPYLDTFSGQFRIGDLWYLQNEHRLFVPRLVALAIARLTNLDMLAQMYFNVVLTIFVWVLIYAIYRHTAESKNRLLVLLPTAFLLFTMALWPRWVDTRPMYLLIAVLGFMAALWVIVTRPPGWRALVFAGVLGWIASLSFFTGHLTWIVVGGLLWFMGYRKVRYYLVWAVMAAVVLIPYLSDYLVANSIARNSAFPGLEASISFIFIFIGSPLASVKSLTLPQDESFWLGVIGLISVCVLWFSNWFFVRNGFRKSLPWLAIIGWVVVSAGVAGVGRIDEFGVNSARAIRYMLYGNIFWIAVVNLGMITLTEPRKSPKSDRVQHLYRFRYAASTFAILVMLVIGAHYAIVQQTVYGDGFLARVEQLRIGHVCLLSYEHASDDCLKNLYPDPDRVRDLAPLLEQRNVTFMRRDTTERIRTEYIVGMQ